MKLRVIEFNKDYYHEDVPFVGGQKKLKKWIKGVLSKARRREEKKDIHDSISSNEE